MRNFLLGLLLANTQIAAANQDFFRVDAIKFHTKEPRDGCGVWNFSMKGRAITARNFQASLEVRIVPRENIFPSKMIGKVYYFDQENRPIASQETPSNSGFKSGILSTQLAFPPLLKGNQTTRVFFAIPDQLKDKKWKAIAVIGDEHELHSVIYPQSESELFLEYPEKKRIAQRSGQRHERGSTMDPLIEHVVKTGNIRQPQITLFLRPPPGITDAAEVKGVMAVCFVAAGVDHIRKQMQMEEMEGDYGGTFAFANKHQLAVLAWGVSNLWDKNRNYDELSNAEAREADRNFDKVAGAWERGALALTQEHGMPQDNFLLWGCSIGAQWAHRLCLRKPNRFLAVYVHIPSSFDQPTPEASRVLWCLTTGEREGGYERSKRFLKACQALQYPIIYKAYPGIGHVGHRDIYHFGFKFFEFALSQKAARIAHDDAIQKLGKSSHCAPKTPWPSSFQRPPFYGDIVNQEVFSASEVQMIPEGFRVVLPTQELAEKWLAPINSPSSMRK